MPPAYLPFCDPDCRDAVGTHRAPRVQKACIQHHPVQKTYPALLSPALPRTIVSSDARRRGVAPGKLPQFTRQSPP